jgi:hypothetical protein
MSETLKNRSTLGIIAAALSLALAAPPAFATENGTQHYPVGINTVTAGNLPPPGGLLLLDYVQSATMPRLAGADGAAVPMDFKLTAVTNATRLLYTWKGVSVAGLNYSTGLVVPLVDLRARIGRESGHDAGVADLDLQNYLGGHSADHTLFYLFGLDLSLPTGHYAKDSVVNTGLNRASVTPNVGVTWFPSRAWEVTGAAAVEISGVNPATHYLSGPVADVDYAVTWRPAALPGLGVGVQGYAFAQLADDTQNGAPVGPDGHRGREFGIGPQLRYDTRLGGVVLKYQRLFGVQNRPSGDKVWLEFCIPLNGAARF